MKLYTDGGARGNPGPAAVGIVLCDGEGKVIFQHAKKIGRATNNEAEYKALIFGLREAEKRGARELDAFLDSELVVKQLNDEYKIKKPELVELFWEVKSIERTLSKISYTHLLREHPKIRLADKLLNIALDGK